ncbi:hypothetical protein AN237_23720 [Raoultella ornithinolytica]|nr:hypothetical protein AN237_23720 [Raoultella ornithinolytica]
MQRLKGCLLIALLYNVNAFATPPINVWLRCANGIHATIKDDVLTAEGVRTLPFEHTENETDQQITLVFADAHTEAKIQIQYRGPAFYLRDTDGSWAPCAVTKIP